jgi:MFS family permease
VLFVNVATFLTSAALVLFLVPPAIERPTTETRRSTRQRYGSDLSEGLRFVAGNRLVLSMVLLATLGNFLDVPLLQVVLPVYASEVFGSPTALGLLLGSFAGGALLGTIVFGVIGSRLPRRRTFLGCWLLLAIVVYGGLVLQPPLPVLVVVGLTGGVLSGPINPIILTVVQAETPPHLLGRVFGALTAVAQAGIPFGAAIIGLVIEGAGLIETIAGMGVLYVLTLAVMFTIPALRRMDQVSAAPAGTVEPPEAAPSLQARACATMKAGL